MRRLYHNRMSETEGARQIDQGGIGATTLTQGAKNLGLVTRDMANQPYGVLLLNSVGAFDRSVLPGSVSDPSNPSLYGGVSVIVNQVLTLKITNYDSFTTYTVNAVGGTAVVKGEDVVFTAGSVAMAGSITLNGESYAITVVSVPEAVVATPSITSPVNGTTSVSATVNVTSSTFSISNSSDTHASSDWEISTDSGFATTFAQSLNDTTNKTSWSVSGLASLTKYYLRTRQRSSGGKVSPWSPISNFTTKAFYPSVQVQRLLSPSPEGGEYFGQSIALSSDGKTLLAGAPGNDGQFSNEGTTYLFQLNGNSSFVQNSQLASDAAGANYQFGASVAVSSDGNRAVVGQPYSYTGAFVYDNKTSEGLGWVRTQSLSGVYGDYYGYTVAISGDGSTIAISAPQKAGTNANQVGAVYIYILASGTWSYQTILTPGSVTSSARFGFSTALSSDGNTLIVGAPYYDGTANEQGAAYVFTRSGSTWTQQAKLVATSPGASDNFGTSVALSDSGDRALVGTPGRSTSVSGDGITFVFQRTGSTWAVQGQLRLSSPASGDLSGSSVALSSDGNTALIGAPRPAQSQSDTGRAGVFTYTSSGGVPTWTQVAELKPASGYYAWFGTDVALSGDGLRAVVSAPHDAASGLQESGDIYVFA